MSESFHLKNSDTGPGGQDPEGIPAAFLPLERALLVGLAEEVDALIAQALPDLTPAQAQVARALAALKRGEKEKIPEAMEAVFLTSGLTAALLSKFWNLTQQLAGERWFNQALNAAIWQSGVEPAAAIWWVKDKTDIGNLELGGSLVTLPAEKGARRAAISTYLEVIGGSEHAETLRGFLRSHEDKLKADDVLWAQVTEALLISSPRDAWSWSRDWRQRLDAQPWMLRHAAVAALLNRRLDEARSTSTAALKKPGGEDCRGFHQMVLALDKALTGPSSKARHLLKLAEASGLPDWERRMCRVVRAINRTREGAERRRRSIWKENLRRLESSGITEDPVASQVLAQAAKDLHLPGVHFEAPEPAEREAGWRRPSTQLFIASYALLFAAIVVFVAGRLVGSWSEGGSASPSFGTVILKALPWLCLALGGIAAAVFSYRKSRNWTSGLTVAVIANALFPAGLVIALAAAVFVKPKEASNEAKSEMTAYEHPGRAFSVNLKDLDEISTQAVQPKAGDLLEGIAIINPDQSRLILGAQTVAGAGGDGAGSSEMAAVHQDRSWTYKKKYEDPAGRSWLRVGKVETKGPGDPVRILKDVALVGNHLVVMEFAGPETRFSSMTQMEATLDRWHKRVGFPPPDKLSALTAIPPAALPAASQAPVPAASPALEVSRQLEQLAPSTTAARLEPTPVPLVPASPLPVAAATPIAAAATPTPVAVATPTPVPAATPVPVMTENLRKALREYFGMAERKLPPPEESLTTLEAAWKENPDAVPVLVDLAQTYSRAGRTDEALKVARRATELAAEDATAQEALGLVLLRANLLAEAGEPLQKAVRLQPENGHYWGHLGFWQGANRQWEAAVASLTKAVDKEPESPRYWNCLVSSYVEQKNAFGGEQAVLELLDLHPEAAPGWHVLGKLQLNSGMPRAGVNTLKKAVTLAPDDSSTWNSLGLAQVRVGEISKATESFAKAASLDDRDAEAWNNLGYAQTSTATDAEAIVSFQKAIAIEPGHTRALVNLANAYARTGQNEDFLKTCEELARHDADKAKMVRSSHRKIQPAAP